jgi:hypothetical protein
VGLPSPSCRRRERPREGRGGARTKEAEETRGWAKGRLREKGHKKIQFPPFNVGDLPLNARVFVQPYTTHDSLFLRNCSICPLEIRISRKSFRYALHSSCLNFCIPNSSPYLFVHKKKFQTSSPYLFVHKKQITLVLFKFLHSKFVSISFCTQEEIPNFVSISFCTQEADQRSDSSWLLRSSREYLARCQPIAVAACLFLRGYRRRRQDVAGTYRTLRPLRPVRRRAVRAIAPRHLRPAAAG